MYVISFESTQLLLLDSNAEQLRNKHGMLEWADAICICTQPDYRLLLLFTV